MSHRSTKPSTEHGSLHSYIIGLIFSLVLTGIAYVLVSKHLVSGSLLLYMILGLAVTQMIVQISFFLHLGRGPKPNWNLYFFIGTIGIVLVVVGGSILIISNLHYNMRPVEQSKKLVSDEAIYQIGGEKTGACEGQHPVHRITIKNNIASPLHTSANKCDLLTFYNEDSNDREIAFGPHPKHDVYAGETVVVLRRGRSKTLTLSESGKFLFHDHLQAQTAGDFIVQ
ncbi:MAG: hypothetical protein NVS1B7_4740 [Candidatus Saccharimonadales bacterium]